MKRVIIESPYAGDVQKNLEYARDCLRDSLSRGEAPLASHLLYTQVLDDLIPEQRKNGIEAGLSWFPAAELIAFYIDRGVSSGMTGAMERARNHGLVLELRRLGGKWATPLNTD